MITKFNFNKTIKRNDFTKIFGNVGKRRKLLYFARFCLKDTKRSRMQKIRRAHQGSKNKVFGTLHALKIRLKYGRHKTIPQFRIYND
jgi:hypothetical protein